MVNRFWSRKWGEFPRHEYNVWHGMRARCYSRNNPQYARYGGRGIGICERWRHDFMAFLSDMGPRPSRAYTLDRLDNDSDYAPENCRWATRYQQAHNKQHMRNAVGVERHRGSWRVRIGIGGQHRGLGSYENFAEAQEAYRQAALRNRIIAELSAAWAPRPDVPPNRADDGSLDRRLLNLLLEASCPRAVSRPCKPSADRENRRVRRKVKSAPRSRRSTQRTSARNRKAKRS